MTEVAPVILAGLIGCYLMSQIVTIAQGIAGGVVFHQFGFGAFSSHAANAAARPIAYLRPNISAGGRRPGGGRVSAPRQISDSGRALRHRLAQRG